jgi:multidrug resistance efflux pump
MSSSRHFALLTCLAVAACGNGEQAAEQDLEPPAPTDRIAVPESVRTNLGLRFVAVERRRIAATLRVPGHFELLPSARREYRTPLPGRVEIVVQPLQRVEQGEVLYRLDSPEWRSMQRELGELTTAAVVLKRRRAAMEPLVEAHRVHEQSLVDAIAVMEARRRNLEQTRASIGGQAAEIASTELQLAQMRAGAAEAAEKRAETTATLAELDANLLAAEDRVALALDTAASVLGMVRSELEGTAETGRVPRWRALDRLEARAVAAATVDALPVASGGWVGVGDLVLTSSAVEQVRFRARGLQSDLLRLVPGLEARVVPPQGSFDVGERVAGTLEIGVGADPEQRTVDLFLRPQQSAPWVRPGVSAFLEIETAATDAHELAVPLSAVLQDGLQRVLFRRDPKDPDTVIRIEGDLGLDDGRWIEVKSGLMDGDEVVLEGAYELMLASSGQAPKGGHFHADGTFHAGEDK